MGYNIRSIFLQVKYRTGLFDMSIACLKLYKFGVDIRF